MLCVSVAGMSAGSVLSDHVADMCYNLFIYLTEREQLILRTTGGKKGKTPQPSVALFAKLLCVVMAANFP